MATYQLLFGSHDWSESDDRPKPYPVSMPPRTEKLSVRLPRALKARLEDAAAREGVSPETWAAQVLGQSVPPDGASAR